MTESLLEAGAILPSSAELKGKVLDVLEARQYVHAALPEPMVRFSAANVAHALDLEMGLLGFEVPKKGVQLGKVRREKLGFPAWALVHDQKNARYALDVVKDLKKAIRRMKSKPGAAKEQIDAIGETLASSVPHFLPSFFEEAARAFIDHDNRSYAQQYFEKARASERTYALDVDDELREESFVAFALAGALSVKSLSNFAAELGERGKAGLESYSRVCIRRTVGGQPPSAATLKDLKNLAKAAGEDPLAAHVHFLDGVLESPALRSAAAGFFKGAKKPLQTLVKDAPEKRAVLLDLFPRAVSQREWLATLKSCGALAALIDAKIDGQSKLSTAAWFSRMFRFGEACPELLDLMVRCAPRLVAEGEAIVPGNSWQLNVGAVEVGLQLGLKMKTKRRNDDDDEELGFHGLEDWAGEFEGDDIPCIAASEEFRKRFVAACSQLNGYDYGPILKAIEGRDALHSMVEAGLEQRIARMKSGGLPALGDSLEFMSEVPDGMFDVFPQLGAALRATDVATSLAKTLQIGFFDELVWPKYEELRGKLKGDDVRIFYELPYVVFFGDKRVIVLDGDDDEVCDFKPKMEKGHSIQAALYVEDELFVVVGTWSASTGYWVSKPDEKVAFKSFYQDSCVRLPDGSLLFGTNRLRKGDQRLESEGHGFFDGETYYAWKDDRLRAFDPETGKLGDEALPEFLTREGSSSSESGQRRYDGFIAPLELPDDALIRSKDGRIGLRWVEPSDDADDSVTTVEDIVGPVGTYRGWRDVSAAYIAPASDELRLLVASYDDVEVWDSHGVPGLADDAEYQHGKTRFFSMSLLKRYRPRDLETSARLRKTTRDTAAALVTAASTKAARKVELDEDTIKINAGVLAAIQEAFPELADTSLRDALAGVVHLAGHRAHSREELLAKVPEASADGGTSRKRVKLPKRTVGDARLPIAMGPFAWPFANGDAKKPTLLSELGELRARFDSLPASGEAQWGPHIWQLGIGHGTAILYRYACCPKRKKADREHLETWVRALEAAGFDGERAKNVRIAFRKKNTAKINQDSWQPTWKVLGDNGVFSWQLGYDKEAFYTFVEHAPNGEFQVVTDEKDDISGPGWATPEHIDAVVAKVDEDGPLPIDAAAAIVSEKTGMSPAEATLWSIAELDGDVWGLAKKGRKAALGMFEHNPFLSPWPTHQKNQLALATGIWMAGPWEDLWDPEVLAKRICDQFFSKHPELPALTADDDVVHESLVKLMPAVSWIASVGLPKGEKLVIPQLHKDQDRWFADEDYHQNGEGFSEADPYIKGLTLALYTAPLRSAIVRSLPAAWKEVQARLMHPSFFEHIYSDMIYTDEPDPEEVAENTKVRAFLDQFGTTIPKELWRGPRKPRKDAPYALPRGDARMVVRGGDWEVALWIHPSAVIEGDSRLQAKGVADCLGDWPLNIDFIFGDAAKSYIALAEKLAGKKGCAGDPRVSAPKSVAAAAKKLDVGEDAAALYLMLAALPHPADATVQKIGGWTKKAREGLAAELVKKKHVLSAKRAGAGRSEFVPGAWTTRGVPRPIEEWKRAHLGWAGKDTPFDGDVIPLAPDRLYASIWKRIDAGDGPGFEDPPKRASKKKKS